MLPYLYICLFPHLCSRGLVIVSPCGGGRGSGDDGTLMLRLLLLLLLLLLLPSIFVEDVEDLGLFVLRENILNHHDHVTMKLKALTGSHC